MSGILSTIDTVSCDPEEWPQDGDPMQPKWVVNVFFQHEDEAKAFIEAASQ